MSRLHRAPLSSRVFAQGPLFGFICIIGIVLFILLFMWRSSERSIWTTGHEADGEDQYSSIASKINDLEIRELIARGKSADVDTTEIDKQLAPLRARLAQLQPRHDQEVETRRLQQEAEAQRQKEEQERKLLQTMKLEAAELEKRCEAVRSKRIADLTVNDVELLKQCGTPVPHLPLVQ
ncbi:MAG: hypothetical protein ABSG79_24900 [Bryobacteraceae bacterium]|jgi:hypothetical protein